MSNELDLLEKKVEEALSKLNKEDDLKSKKNLVTASNEYINSFHDLTRTESRVIELAIVDARETCTGLNANTPLKLSVKRYAQVYGINWDSAYSSMLSATDTLIKKQYEYPHPKYPDDPRKNVKSNYLQDFSHLVDEGVFELCFTRSVVEAISRLDGKTTPYTQYFLEQTAKMNSVYNIRLFQILSTWRHTLADTSKLTPLYDIQILRKQLGLSDSQYRKVADFKLKILDPAIKEINELTDLFIEKVQVKQGRKIIGFKFLLINKNMKDVKEIEDNKEDKRYFYTFSSEKQLKFVATKLSKIHTIVGHKSYRSYQDAIDDIALELMNREKQQSYIKYLEEHEELEGIKLKKEYFE